MSEQALVEGSPPTGTAVKALAAGFEVTGTVRNLTDGRVELMVEGEREELKAFQQAIRESELGHFIRAENALSKPAQEAPRFLMVFVEFCVGHWRLGVRHWAMGVRRWVVLLLILGPRAVRSRACVVAGGPPGPLAR